MLSFYFIDEVVGYVHVAKNIFPIAMATFSFLVIAGLKVFLQKLACILRSLISENMAHSLFIFNIMFVFGYYKEFTFVLSQNNCQLFYKYNSVNCCIYHTVN